MLMRCNMDDVLGLNEFKVVSKREDKHNILFVVEPVHYFPICPSCGSTIVNKHGKISRHARDANYFNKLCELEIISDRYKCSSCGKTFMPIYNAVDESAKITNRLKDKIKKETLKNPFKKLADEYSLSVPTVKRFFSEYVKELEELRIIKTPSVIGIDEAHLNKQMRAVITDIKEKKIIDILPTRSKEAVKDFLSGLNYDIIKVGTIDMYRPYKEALLDVNYQAKIVIDKFHVVQYAVNAMETIRKKLGENIPKEERRILLNTRFSLLKNKEDAKDVDIARMESLFKKYPDYETAYNLKENFRDIYQLKDKKDAWEAFKRWENLIPQHMGPFKDVAKTVNNWKVEIFNYFDYPYTNAFTESVNNLIKEIEKRGRGYTFDVLRAKVLYGTSATRAPKYSRPKEKPLVMNMMTGGSFDFSSFYNEKPVLESGFGVDVHDLMYLLENNEF